MAARREKALAKAGPTVLLIGPFIRTCMKFIQLRKGFRRLYCSFVEAMFNHTASLNNSKGESFPFDFNLQDVIYTIEEEISPGKGK